MSSKSKCAIREKKRKRKMKRRVIGKAGKLKWACNLLLVTAAAAGIVLTRSWIRGPKITITGCFIVQRGVLIIPISSSQIPPPPRSTDCPRGTKKKKNQKSASMNFFSKLIIWWQINDFRAYVNVNGGVSGFPQTGGGLYSSPGRVWRLDKIPKVEITPKYIRI